MHMCHTSVQPVFSFQAQTALRRPLSSLPGERWRRTSAPSVTAPTRRGRGASSARPCAPDTSAGRCRAGRPHLGVCGSPAPAGTSGRLWEAPAKCSLLEPCPGTFWAILGGTGQIHKTFDEESWKLLVLMLSITKTARERTGRISKHPQELWAKKKKKNSVSK